MDLRAGNLPGPAGARGKAERDPAERIRGTVEDSPKLPDGYAHLTMANDRLGDPDIHAYCHGGLASLIDSYVEFEMRGGIYAKVRPLRSRSLGQGGDHACLYRSLDAHTEATASIIPTTAIATTLVFDCGSASLKTDLFMILLTYFLYPLW